MEYIYIYIYIYIYVSICHRTTESVVQYYGELEFGPNLTCFDEWFQYGVALAADSEDAYKSAARAHMRMGASMRQILI